ncbi:MAG TPA: hemolysin family protein [bacterium]|nr:hemolysin family protein [bacterium]
MIIFIKICAVFALVLLNGFFVASEFAIVKIRETRLSELAEQGSIRARVGRVLVRNLDAYLSATQLGITMASLGLGWIGEPMVSEELKPLLRGLGIHNPTTVSSISIVTGFIIITFLHIVFGELAPKSLAIRRTEDTALWISMPLRLFFWMFWPAIWVLNAAALGTLKLVGITPASDEELAHSDAELMMILSEAAAGGQISEQERKISERALRLADSKARQVMVPRNEIVYFSLAQGLESSLDKARRNNFARYPLCETDLDKVIGMVHIRDVFWMLREPGAPDLKAVAHEALLVSEEESLEKVLQRFRDTHIHLALVVDEVGSVSGLVTLEDVLEQLVGAIQDEFDTESPWLKMLAPEVYEAAGRAPLALLRSKFGIGIEGEDVVTISGFITDRMGRFPKEGDVVRIKDWKVTVTRTDALKVKTCLLERVTEKSGDG